MLIFIIQIAYGRNKDKNEEIKGQEEIFFQSAFNKKKVFFNLIPFEFHALILSTKSANANSSPNGIPLSTGGGTRRRRDRSAFSLGREVFLENF